MTDYELFPEHCAHVFISDDERIMESGTTQAIEEPCESRGQKRWVYTVKAPAINSKGEVK